MRAEKGRKIAGTRVRPRIAARRTKLRLGIAAAAVVAFAGLSLRLDGYRAPASGALAAVAAAFLVLPLPRAWSRHKNAWARGVEARRRLRRRMCEVRSQSAQLVDGCKSLEQRRDEWEAVIAHDLRQPISTITLSVDFVRQLRVLQGPVPDNERRALDRIALSAGRLGRMVEDLLDVSRLDARQLELRRVDVDVENLLRTIVDGASTVLTGHVVRLRVEGPLPVVFGDADRLEQVLGNLLSNAAKYGRDGSEIRVEARTREADVCISITNEGHGIAPSEIAGLFGRFYRTRAAREGKAVGIGLGLYIVRGLVEAHGGTIGVRSIPERETTFELSLPARRSEAVAVSQA